MEVIVPPEHDDFEEVNVKDDKFASRKHSNKDDDWLESDALHPESDDSRDVDGDESDDRLSDDYKKFETLQQYERQQLQAMRDRLEHLRDRSRDNYWVQQQPAAARRSADQAPHPSPSHKHLEGGRRGHSGHWGQGHHGHDSSWSRQKPTGSVGRKQPAIQASRGKSNITRPTTAADVQPAVPYDQLPHSAHPFHHIMSSLDLHPAMYRRFHMGPWDTVDSSIVDGVHGNDDESSGAVWWKGANVCERRDEKEESSNVDVTDDAGQGYFGGPTIRFYRVMTSVKCESTDASYRCTTTIDAQGRRKTTTLTFECCPGYERSSLSSSGSCIAARNLTDLLRTTEHLGVHEFVEALRSTGLDDDLSMGNYTIFVTTDDAVSAYLNTTGLFKAYGSQNEDFIGGEVVQLTPAMMEQAEKMKLQLAGTVVEGFARTSDMTDEMLIPTAVPDSNIRINIYDIPRRVVTANCVPITSSDNYATNGIVHVTSDVVPLAVDSILTLVRSRDDLSILAGLIDQSPGLRQALDGSQLTLFAPTNAAFASLSRKNASSNMAMKGMGGNRQARKMPSPACMDKILRHHLLPHTICTAAVPARAKTANSLRRYVTLERVARETGKNSSSKQLLVDGRAKIIDGDCMASNGVVHVIDDVILPLEAKDTIDVLRQRGGANFADMLTRSSASEELNKATNVTIFAPTDNAIDKFLKENPGATLDIKAVRFHVVPGQLTSRELRHVTALNTTLAGRQLTVKQYSSLPFGPHEILTTQCARVLHTDHQSCGATIHFVDKVLVPPSVDVEQLLKEKQSVQQFTQLLLSSGVMDELRALNSSYTILVPSNHATFHTFTVEQQRAILRHHVIPSVVCCASASQSGHFLAKSRERVLDPDSSVTFSRDIRGNVLIDDVVHVTSCDVMATNGVIHVIDQFLPASVQKHCPQCAKAKEPQYARRLDHSRLIQFIEDRHIKPIANRQPQLKGRATG